MGATAGRSGGRGSADYPLRDTAGKHLLNFRQVGPTNSIGEKLQAYTSYFSIFQSEKFRF
jgi:hypothetical protein